MPGQASEITVYPPQAGVVQKYAFQMQPPYSCFKSVNFWPHDAKTGRLISCTRPPLVPFQTPGDPVNMLVRLNDPVPTLLAAVEGTLYRYKNGWLSVASSPAIRTGGPVYATPFLRKVVIANGGDLLVYSADGNTLAALVATVGTIPDDCRVIASWQGGIWVSGSPTEGEHIVKGSRTGSITDWDETAEDGGGAFSSAGDNEGLISDPVTALMPMTADTMMVGCEDSLWAMRGHPRRGGVLEPMSSFLGVMGQGAWTKGPGDQLFGMSKAGLFVMPPTVGAIPTLISRELIPDKLVGLAFDRSDPVVNLQYDPRWNCIYICVRGAQQQAWYYSLDEGGFFEMEFTDYPLVMEEFDPFMSEETSGVLFGGEGYGGLARFDTRGSEVVTNAPQQFIGPIRLSDSPATKSRVREANVVLGNDMFAGTGGVTIYCGTSGEQAAISAEADSGVARYTCARNSLIANGGRFYPNLAGHAAVMKLESDTQLGNSMLFESGSMALEPAGRSVPMRVAAATAFPTPTSGYAWTIPQLPTQNQTDFTFFVDLARLPASWWSLPNPGGVDIRVALADGTLLPFDLIDFNQTFKTGFLTFKRTQNATGPQHIRIWAGSALATAPNPGDAIGRFNAYDAGWLAFYPTGGATDRTSNLLNLTMSGSPTVGGVAGPIGNTGTAYNGSTQYGQSLGGFTDNVPITLMGFFSPDAFAADKCLIGVNFTNNGVTNSLNNSSRVRVFSASKRLGAETGSSVGGFSFAEAVNVAVAGQYKHFACRFNTITQRIAVLDGNYSQSGENTTSRTMNDVDSIIVGAISMLTPASEFFDGNLSLLAVHTVDRSSSYIAYQKAMQNQSQFWGTWKLVSAAYPF